MSRQVRCSSVTDQFVQYAISQIGKPYTWGGDVRAMAVDTTTPLPALVTVPRVEILEVGEDWETSTGVFTFTSEDLVSAIESQDDPAVRTPTLKLGHTDPRFDGQPAFGKLENMSLDNNGQTLLADLVGMPLWLAQVMASAYPRRSIEGTFQYKSKTGNTWPFILTGLALLGDMYPAINTLEDIQALWGAEPPVLLPVEDVDEIAASGAFFRARRVEAMPEWLKRKNAGEEVAAAAAVRAQVGLDDIRRAYYDSLDAGQMWWWIREIRVNPLQLIVDDDEGSLYTVDINVDSSDNVEFGEPTQVKIQYVAAGRPISERKAGQLVAASYGTSEEAGGRQKPPVQGTEEQPPASGTVHPTSTDTPKENGMQLSPEVLAALGLNADATDDQVNQALATRLSAQPEGGEGGGSETPAPTTPETPAETAPPAGTPAETPAPETPAEQPGSTPQVPEGMVLVDEATLAELREGSVAARTLMQERRTTERDRALNDAVRAGKFPRARIDHWKGLWDKDPDGTKQALASMAAGLIPVTEQGNEGDEPVGEQASYPDHWKQSVAASRRGLGDRIKVVGD